MQVRYLNLRTFKKGKEALELPFMPVNAFVYNNNLHLIKNQYFLSHIEGLICLSTLLNNERKKLSFFGM